MREQEIMGAVCADCRGVVACHCPGVLLMQVNQPRELMSPSMTRSGRWYISAVALQMLLPDT